MTESLRQGFSVETAWGGKGSLSAKADFTATGAYDIGWSNGTFGPHGPTNFKWTVHPLATFGHTSAAHTGLVMAYQTKVIVGIGGLGFATGLYLYTPASVLGRVEAAATARVPECVDHRQPRRRLWLLPAAAARQRHQRRSACVEPRRDTQRRRYRGSVKEIARIVYASSAYQIVRRGGCMTGSSAKPGAIIRLSAAGFLTL